MGCGQGLGFYLLCKGKVIKGFKQGNGMARSVFLESGGGSWSGNRLWWQGMGAQTTAALGGRGEVRERSDQGFHDGLEPRKGHCYNLFLMRNIINIRDQRGNNQTQPVSPEKRKFRNDQLHR